MLVRYEVRVFPARVAKPYSVWDRQLGYVRQSFVSAVDADAHAAMWNADARVRSEAEQRAAERAAVQAREDAAAELLRGLLPA